MRQGESGKAAESGPAAGSRPSQFRLGPFKPHKNLTWRLLCPGRAYEEGDTERALWLLSHPTSQPPLTWALCSWKVPNWTWPPGPRRQAMVQPPLPALHGARTWACTQLPGPLLANEPILGAPRQRPEEAQLSG